MIVNPVELARAHNLKPQSFSLILDKDDYLIAKLETENGPIVLKASTHPNHVSDWDARNCILLGNAGLPVPEVFAYGEDPVSFAFLTWIEGEPLSANSPVEAQIEAGRLIKRINHLPNRPKYNRDYSHDSWMEGWLNVAMTYWSAQAGVTSRMVDDVWDSFYALRPLLATRGTHYILQDGRPEHFRVLDNRLNGIIDLHDCQPGDGAMDIAVFGLFDETLLENALKGYGAVPEEQEVIEELLPFYLFLRRLSAADYNSRLGSPLIAQQALELANSDPYKQN